MQFAIGIVIDLFFINIFFSSLQMTVTRYDL